MATVIVVKKPDKGIIIIKPNYKKFGPEKGKIPFAEMPEVAQLANTGLDFFFCDESEIPDKSILESRVQLYWDEGNSIKVDKDWNIRLMPAEVIKRRQIKKISSDLDQECNSDKPDVVKIHRMQKEIKRLESLRIKPKFAPQNIELFEDKKKRKISFPSTRKEIPNPKFLELYQLALNNLDRRVQGGESDKAIVRKKIQDKIKELENV